MYERDEPPGIGRRPLWGASRLVGRSAELALIEDLAREVALGRPICVALTGEPGIGKTRLARAALGQLRQAGYRTGQARAEEWTATVPFRLVAQSLRDLAAGRIAIPEPDTSDPALARIQLLDRFTAAFADLAQPPGIVCLWDDARWADPSSLEYLPYLLDVLADRPILFVLTVGQERLAVDHPLARALDRLNRDRRLFWIPVARLGPNETCELAAAVIGADLPESVTDRLYAETSGNPFDVEETVKALVDNHELRQSARGWTYVPAAPASVPHGVKAAIEQRIARLPKPTRQALAGAAVLGRRFNPDAVAELLALDPVGLGDRLQPAIAASLIEAAGDQFEFTHDRIRAVIYENLPPSDHQRLHLAAARLLERERTEPAAPVSLHWRLAGNPTAAIRAALVAGDQARRLGGPLEALAHFGAAADLADRPEVEPALRSTIWESVADARRHLTPGRAVADYERALAGTTDPAARRRLRRKIGVAQTRSGQYRAAAAIFERAGPDLDARERLEKAFNLVMMGELDAGLAALPDLGALGPGPLAARWHGTHAVAAYYRGDPETCLREGETAYRESGEVIGLRYVIGSVLVRYYLTYRAEAVAEIDRLAEEAVRWADRLGEHLPAVVARALRGQARFLRGDWPAARADFEWAEHRAPSAESNWAYGFLVIYAPAYWLAIGQLDRARALIGRGLADLAGSGLAPAFAEIPVRLLLAELGWQSGDLGAAAAEVERAAALRGPATRCVDAAIGIVLARVARQRRDPRTARRQAEAALQTANDLGDRLAAIGADRALGALGGTAAAGHFRQALDAARQIGSPLEELRTLDAWSAVGPLAPPLAQRRAILQRSLATLTPAPPAAAPDDVHLTDRELEVLTILAEGVRTREIARRLVLSEKTVQRHLANIYAKIGVDNRVAAIKYFQERYT